MAAQVVRAAAVRRRIAARGDGPAGDSFRAIEAWSWKADQPWCGERGLIVRLEGEGPIEAATAPAWSPFLAALVASAMAAS
jgi:hypothetical protein